MANAPRPYNPLRPAQLQRPPLALLEASRAEALEVVGQSLIACVRVAVAFRHLALDICAVLLTFALLLLLCFNRLQLLRLVSACGGRKTSPDFRRDDAPTIVFVLLHRSAQLRNLCVPVVVSIVASALGPQVRRRAFQDKTDNFIAGWGLDVRNI